MNLEKNDLRDKSRVVRFVYVGRLVQEKGFDRVIRAAKYFLSDQNAKATLAICGDGALRVRMLAELSSFPGFLDASDGRRPQGGERVVYFGHQTPEQVKAHLVVSHYLLMPSRFLETFGLSALEAVSCGVPVLAYRKWGLSQFLLSEHALEDTGDDGVDGREFLSLVERVCEHFSGPDWRRQSHTARDIASRYSSEAWKKEAGAVLGDLKKVLLVTDYGAPVGGIETHVETVAALLREAGYEVRIFAAIRGSSRFVRLIALAFSFWNPFIRSRLKKELALFRPDAVWCHSVVRAIGPAGLGVLASENFLRIKTYHDLGYFGAYATQFQHEAELVPAGKGFGAFYRSAPLLDRIVPVYVVFKYFRLRSLARTLGSFQIHCVPSDFMREAVRSFVAREDADVRTVAHPIGLWK